MYAFHKFGFAQHFGFKNKLLIRVKNFNIPVIFDRVKMDIGHTKFFSLIHIRRSLVHMQAQSKHLGRFIAILVAVISPAGNNTRLVMIIPVQGIPCCAVEPFLPFVEVRFHGLQIKWHRRPLSVWSVIDIHHFELKDHVQFPAVVSGILFRFFDRHARRFAYRNDIVFRKHLFVHFLQKLMDPRAIAAVFHRIAVNPAMHLGIRIALILGNKIDHIHTEAVNAFFEPARHHVIHFMTDLFVFPVQVRLLFSKQMQIPLSEIFVVFPCRSRKRRSPVVRCLVRSTIFPDIIIMIRIFPGFSAFYEPRMLVRRMIDHQIHYDPDPFLVRFFEQIVKILHRAELVHDLFVIGNVIAVVRIRGLIDRRKPDHVDSQIGQVIQFFPDPVQIADPVVVRIIEAARINLIHYALFPPRFVLFHLVLLYVLSLWPYFNKLSVLLLTLSGRKITRSHLHAKRKQSADCFDQKGSNDPGL